MNQDDIIRMALGAGFGHDPATGHLVVSERYPDLVVTLGLERFFAAAYAAGAAAEREALLDLVDDYAKNNADLKAAIRERGQE